jgi:hypothetical protein
MGSLDIKSFEGRSILNRCWRYLKSSVEISGEAFASAGFIGYVRYRHAPKILNQKR